IRADWPAQDHNPVRMASAGRSSTPAARFAIPTADASVLFGLQRLVGNRAVSAMIEQRRTVDRADVGDVDCADKRFGQPDWHLAPSRPVPPQRNVLSAQRFEAGEHAQFGARPGEQERVFSINGVRITYGQMIAMGDMVRSPEDLRTMPSARLQHLVDLVE